MHNTNHNNTQSSLPQQLQGNSLGRAYVGCYSQQTSSTINSALQAAHELCNVNSVQRPLVRSILTVNLSYYCIPRGPLTPALQSDVTIVVVMWTVVGHSRNNRRRKLYSPWHGFSALRYVTSKRSDGGGTKCDGTLQVRKPTKHELRVMVSKPSG